MESPGNPGRFKLPEELRRREDRLAAIVAAKARLEAAQREADDARGRRPEWERNPKGGQPYKRAYGEPEDKAQSNFTDPDSAIMKTGAEGFQQCYNAQVAVDGDHQLIVATELTTNASDQGAMVGLLDEVKDTFDAQPETVLADAGYCNERDLSELEGRGIDGYVAPGREGKKTARRDASHGREAGHTSGAGAVRATQVAVRSAQWLDQGSPWIPAIQRAGPEQGARGMGLGVSGAEHQAPATASGSVRAPARQWDMARITPIGRLAGRLGPSRVPCAPLRPPVPRCSCPSSHRFRPVHPLARLELSFCGADS